MALADDARRMISPYGSGFIFEPRCSFPADEVRVTGRFCRKAPSPGRCDWVLMRFRAPLGLFDKLVTPLVRLELDPAEVLPRGRWEEEVVGEDEGCWALTPFTPVWGKGGGGRFIFGG